MDHKIMYTRFESILIVINFEFMPQLLPFYFLNTVSFVYFILAISIVIFSKYILPNISLAYLVRFYLGKNE